MLNFVMCDDNEILLKKFSKMIESILINNNLTGQVIFTATNPDDILQFVKYNQVDVLLLDIQLKSSKTGIDLAKEIREFNKNCYLIFITAHLEYAMIAYKLKTFDFLSKPITYEVMEETIFRLFNDVNSTSKTYLKIDSKNTFIDENEICYIKRDGMKLVYHTQYNDFTTYSSFNKIQDALPKNFIRCHKSFITNLNRISNVDAKNNRILFMDNSSCDIGPLYKTDFLEIVKNKFASNSSPFATTYAKL